MKAEDYFASRGIALTPLVNRSVGRLSLDWEFSFMGGRGVVVCPARGTVSDRYLSLLFSDGVSYVVAECGSTLMFYEAQSNTSEVFSSVRALRPSESKLFPSQELFDYLSFLLHQVVKKRESISVFLSNLLTVRIADEQSSNDDEWVCSISGTVDECSAFISRISGKLKEGEINAEAVLRLCAVLAGFRLTPSTPEESAQLIDWVARAWDDTRCFHGLPLALAPVFQAIGKQAAGSTSLVTFAAGAQFSVFSGSNDEELFMENMAPEILSLLRVLCPQTVIIDDCYLESKSVREKRAVVLIPPFGRSMQLKKEYTSSCSFFKGDPASKKYPAEYLYTIKSIEQCKPNGMVTVVLPESILSGTSHKAFRDWLLNTVQVLGVVSLPGGFCFSGTGLRCSVLFMKKTEQLPSDYTISMIELQKEDFAGDAIAGTIEAVKAVFQRESCV